MSVPVITPKLKPSAGVAFSTETEESVFEDSGDFLTTPDADDDNDDADADADEDADEKVAAETEELIADLVQKSAGPGEKWTCTVCNLEYRDETETRRHIEAVHIEVPRPAAADDDAPSQKFVCPVCSKNFKFSKTLSNHLAKNSCSAQEKRRKVAERDIEWGGGQADIQKLPHGGFMCLKCNKGRKGYSGLVCCFKLFSFRSIKHYRLQGTIQ